MNTSTTSYKIKAILLSAVLAITSASASATYYKPAKRGATTPAGFDQTLLYMGTGLFDPNNANPRPGLTNCSGLFCDGDFFQKNVMGRTDEEIYNLRQEAKDFFLQRFGIDVDDPANADRIAFEMFTVNPDFEYRVHLMSGKTTPPEGWMIRDGGFRIDILDPQGYELGGESEGTFAPAGFSMFFGNYNILITNKRGKPVDELIIFYKSLFPAGTMDNGSFIFVCEMFHEQWGEGVGFGNIRFIPQENGLMRGNGRNILTFPPASDFNDWPEFPLIDAHPKPKWWYYYYGHKN